MSDKMHTTADGLTTGKLRIVKGDFVDQSGPINSLAPREMQVIVTEDGKAFPFTYEDSIYNASDFGPVGPLAAERWGDGDRLGRQFSPDAGEFERCGIKFELCGSAA